MTGAADDAADDAPEVLYDVDGHVATITLNRPHRRNAISVRMLVELGEVAGAEIAVLGEGIGCGFRVAVVADHHGRPHAFQRAGLARAWLISAWLISAGLAGDGLARACLISGSHRHPRSSRHRRLRRRPGTGWPGRRPRPWTAA